MTDTHFRQSIYDLLQDWRGLNSLKELFWSQLNYDRVNETLSPADWPQAARDVLAEPPVVFGEAGVRGQFKVLYTRLAAGRLRLTDERVVVNRLMREFPYALFVFSDREQRRWHLVNVRDAPRLASQDEQRRARALFRRIAIGPEERVRTATERIAMLDVAAIQQPGFDGVPVLELQRQHDEAFDVEAVTEAFFEDYKRVFADLQERLRGQTGDAVWAHDAALQLLNRLLFLYFIQRKRWLGDDPDFLCDFWQAYKAARRPKDSFYSEWLSVLFFEAFNRQFQAGRSDRQHLPPRFREALAGAPFLNGGLFTRNDLDTRHVAIVADAVFAELFDAFSDRSPGFLERYNFTIAEDTPFDQEVAVDPEMIGKVYESLVNITSEGVDEDDQRGSAGIFYTPRVEIDLMCRLVLLDYLSNHLPNARDLLRNAVFAFDPEEKRDADAALAAQDAWPGVHRLLCDATFLDPACGSGSLLVGMLAILDDLLARANERIGGKESAYMRRRRIIGQSLYGVDVMPWAVHVAELRLWLQLVVESDLKPAELTFSPLLPNLSFKVRPGDSLVQEIGGIVFSPHQGPSELPSALKARLKALKDEKLRFFHGREQAASEAQMKRQELALFRDILDERIRALEEGIKAQRRRIAQTGSQPSMLGGVQGTDGARGVREAEAEIERLQGDLAGVRHARQALRDAQDVPFVWDIAFVEIFEGERGGFDMVAGNPPYVRQEAIAPPTKRESDYSAEDWKALKAAYKVQLQASVAEAFPRFFGLRPGKPATRKLDGKSDLYIYFYLHGLSLLNPQGAFVFITSNSWLDVGYGADLQEFLLKHSHVRLVLDNQVRRSFKQADVNTVIVLLGPADDRASGGLEKTARFVMATVPFEELLSPIVFAEIEEAQGRTARQEYRAVARSQRELLQEGMEAPDEDAAKAKPLPKAPRYGGNKWGGKYLRAPDIYWTILEKGKGKLVRLGDIAEVRFGIKTGADDWFYLTEKRAQELGIEERFLKPVLTDPGDRNVPGVLVTAEQADRLIIWVHQDRRGLKGTALLEWIEIGETQLFKGRGDTWSIPALRPSVRGRRCWYELPQRDPAPILWIEVKKRRSFTLHNVARLLADRSFYDIVPKPGIDPELLCALLNATVVALWCELQGNAPGGSGAGVQMTVAEVRKLLVPDLRVYTPAQRAEMVSAFGQLSRRAILPIYAEVEQQDRAELDEVALDPIGLDSISLRGLYTAVSGLARARLDKAVSLGGTTR